MACVGPPASGRFRRQRHRRHGRHVDRDGAALYRFEDKRATGKSMLALLAARKIGTANDPATPNCKTLENVKRYPLKTLRKIWHCRMSAFRPRREK
jgi:hypothetical protein